VLRLLITAGALACIVSANIAVAQEVPTTGPVPLDGPEAAPDRDSSATPPVEGHSAADDPLGTARAAIDQAKALAGSHSFQSRLERQRAGLTTASTQPLPKPTFDVGAPQSIGPGAITDALAPASRQWAQTNQQPLLILVSFSMPDSELQQLAIQGARIGAPLVLRGLVDDSFPATQKRLMRFRQIHGAGFRVDPTLFQRFAVNEVPTFILPLEPLQTCSQQSCPAPAHVQLTGDAGLDYVLDEIDRRSADPRAHSLVQPMRSLLTAE
jgi:type-F conjugative transfer system pilin assembly protein TrbC